MPSNEPRLDLAIFVATHPDQVPEGVEDFISVDGSVPGAAWTWDHHRTGEQVNLDAMPARIDLNGVAAVATTMADCDALASVVAVLFGGEPNVPEPARVVLRAASHHCDHLRGHPGLPDEVNRQGDALNRYVANSMSQAAPDAQSPVFATLCRGVAVAASRGELLPAVQLGDDEQIIETMRALDRLQRRGDLVIIDWRGFPRGWRATPLIGYQAEPGALLGITIDDHPEGGPRYTVGTAPDSGLDDITPMLLDLARAEHAHGKPCLAPEPVAGNENWGGRATVFGSPWNYGSRLSLRAIEDSWGKVRSRIIPNP